MRERRQRRGIDLEPDCRAHLGPTSSTQVSVGSHSAATRRSVHFTLPHRAFTCRGARTRSTSRSPVSSSLGSAPPASREPTSIARTSRASAAAES
ncbi:MAG: hypothetical protein ACREI8_15785, partial [Myxococcota bacterium]